MGAVHSPPRVAPDALIVDRTSGRRRSVGKDAALRRLLAAGDALAVLLALTVALVRPRPAGRPDGAFCGASPRLP